MFCKNCGNPLKDDDLFCQNCGMKITNGKKEEKSEIQNTNSKEKKGGTGIVYSLIGIMIVILFAVLVFGGYYLISGKNLKKVKTTAVTDVNSGNFANSVTKVTETVISPTPTATISVTPVPTVSSTPIPTVIETPIPTEIPVQSEYVLAESGSAYLTREQVTELSLYEMYLARNEIYARHGRMFKKEDLQQYFNSQSWYTPMYSPEAFSESGFNDYEKENIKLIKSVEEDYNSPYL